MILITKSSHPEVFCKKSILKKFAQFQLTILLKKGSGAGVFL